MKTTNAKMPSNESNRQPEGLMVLRTQSMPKDANPNGDIFGGWVMLRNIQRDSFAIHL